MKFKMMKNLRILMLLLIASLTILSVKASDEDYELYDARSCKMVKNYSSACNQGTEPFYKFFKKFKTSKSFRKQRTIFCNEDQSWQDGCVEPQFFDCLDGRKYETYRWKDEWCATWADVSKNQVTYQSGYFGDGDDSGWSFVVTFKRIKGKWYLVKFIFV